MIQIELEVKGGGSKKFDAAKILADVNDSENFSWLQAMNWGTDQGKLDFLMGKNHAEMAIVSTPLSEEDAKQAIKEYRELGYR